MAATAVTLNDLEGHSPVAGLFKCNSSNICEAFYTISTDSVLSRFLCISRAYCVLVYSLSLIVCCIVVLYIAGLLSNRIQHWLLQSVPSGAGFVLARAQVWTGQVERHGPDQLRQSSQGHPSERGSSHTGRPTTELPQFKKIKDFLKILCAGLQFLPCKLC